MRDGGEAGRQGSQWGPCVNPDGRGKAPPSHSAPRSHACAALAAASAGPQCAGPHGLTAALKEVCSAGVHVTHQEGALRRVLIHRRQRSGQLGARLARTAAAAVAARAAGSDPAPGFCLVVAAVLLGCHKRRHHQPCWPAASRPAAGGSARAAKGAEKRRRVLPSCRCRYGEIHARTAILTKGPQWHELVPGGFVNVAEWSVGAPRGLARRSLYQCARRLSHERPAGI